MTDLEKFWAKEALAQPCHSAMTRQQLEAAIWKGIRPFDVWELDNVGQAVVQSIANEVMAASKEEK